MKHLFVLCMMLCMTCLTFISIAESAQRRVPQDYPFIQSAINASNDGDTVIVASGTYSGALNTNLQYNGKAITVMSASGPETTVIDCQQNGRAFLFAGGETESSVVDGFTIRNGRMTGSEYAKRGGAIFCENSSPKILNCHFEDNVSEAGGGAIAIAFSGYVRIARCTFTGNSSGSTGGALLVRAGAEILDCDIAYNHASASGGGLAIVDGHGIFAYLRIDFNTSNICGAGVVVTNTQPIDIINCRISWNESGSDGAGVYSGFSRANFYNCTIGLNTANGVGGLFAEGDYAPTLRNCIVWGNGGPGIESLSSPVIVAYSDIEWHTGQTYPGSGNMNADPLFVTDWLRLSHTAAGQTLNSPCINAGSGSSASSCISTFLGYWCMDEFSTRTDALPDTGTVDMGFHVLSNIPTPTPSPTPTITHTPTPSPTMTPSPTPTPMLCGPDEYDHAILSESFSVWPPAGWIINDNDEYCQWESNLICGRTNYAGYETMAACCDNSWCGGSARYRTDLITPPFDLTSETEARLEFTLAFENGAMYDYLKVLYSIDGSDGGELLHLSEDVTPLGPGQVFHVDLSDLVGHDALRLRFNYHSASTTGYLLLDNIRIKVCRTGASPTPTTVPSTPTPPPVPTWTPTPESTPPCDRPGCSIQMPSTDFTEGDTCYCRLFICNPAESSLGTLPVFVILDVWGSYYFAPGFTDFEYSLLEINPGLQSIDVLAPFTWPGGVGTAQNINWYAGITDLEVSELIGDFGFWSFGWH